MNAAQPGVKGLWLRGAILPAEASAESVAPIGCTTLPSSPSSACFSLHGVTRNARTASPSHLLASANESRRMQRCRCTVPCKKSKWSSLSSARPSHRANLHTPRHLSSAVGAIFTKIVSNACTNGLHVLRRLQRSRHSKAKINPRRMPPIQVAASLFGFMLMFKCFSTSNVKVLT